MSQNQISFPQTKNKPYIAKLNIKKIKNKRNGIVYSSRSQSLYPTETLHPQSQTQRLHLRTKNSKSRASSTNKSVKKQINQLVIPFNLLQNIKLLNQKRLTPQIDLIKQTSHKVLQANTRESRFKLVDVLQQKHSFFTKINTNIAQAIILLSKPCMYYKGQLIFSSSLNQINPYKTLSSFSSNQNTQKQNLHNPQCLGFIIYGKIQLSNDKLFYSNYLLNTGTLFQGKFINKNDKIDYYINVLDTTLIFWLTKQSYYVIRKQCFLTLDLKYQFGEFQNMLKKEMVQKKLLKQQNL